MKEAPASGGLVPGQGAPAPSMDGAMADMMKMMSPSSAAAKSSQTAAGCCGVGGPKPFYPSMMDFPALTEDARKIISKEAIARLGVGSEALTTGQAKLHHALSSRDFTAASEAIKEVREGLSLAESGANALQALKESRSPRQLALNWFQRQTAIDKRDASLGAAFGELSWSHIAAMALLALALTTALLLRWLRIRRISQLAERLMPGGQASQGAPVTSLGGASIPNSAGVASSTQATAQTPVQRPWQGILRIKAIFEETPNVKTFRLMEPNLGSIPFNFLPGQYASITSEIDGKKVRRSYTISSSPTQRDYIELTIKREQYGLESRHLHDHAQTGDLIEISAPAGRFFFTGREAEGIVLIAGGVGITPMMSVLRSLTDRSYEHEIYLLYAANAPSDLIFREECDYLARRHAKLKIAYIVAKSEGTPWTGPVGFITAEFIAASVPDIARRRIHLCGPPPMMEAVKTALEQLKVPSEQVKTEQFAPPKGGPVLETEPPTPSVASPPPIVTTPSAHATVSFSKSGKSGQLAPDQSVLEAAEAIGVTIDYECRVGTCGRCKVPLRQGAVTMEVQDALTGEDKANGIILACQAKSVNDLVVEA